MQKINKLLAMLLVLVLVIGMLPVSALAAGEAVISISKVEAVAGDKVEVMVSLADNPGLTVLRLQVNYDAEKLDLIGVKDAGLLKGYQGDPNETEFDANPMTLYWADDLAKENNSANGTLATLTFKVLDDASYGDVANVTVAVKDAYNWELKDQTVKTEAGSVTVTAKPAKVTFRLIGDTAHEEEPHEEYVTWIPTTEYTGITVYDVFMEAIENNGLAQKGVEKKGYVEAIQAPAVLGGYWLEAYTNGQNSGWMFTVNGEHPSVGMKGCVLNDGDAILFHYVDDWAKEEKENTWLEAEDITPEEYLEGKKPVHTHTEEVIPAKAPTCTETGLTEGKKCATCGEVLVKQETVAAKGHKEVDVAGKEATCTEKGLTAGKKCSVCGTVTVAQKEIPAKGHTEKIVDAKEATWYAEGYTGDTYCSVCNVLVKKGSVVEKTKDQPENPFVDVEEGKFYFTPVLWAVEEDVTTGTSATTFDPNKDCTRAQVVTFLWRAAGEPEPSSTEHPFTDLNEKAFYYKAVLWAVENEITNGLTATTFGPGEECTRGQVVTFLHRFAGKPAPESLDHPFADVKENAFYYNAMLWAVENSITNGISKTEFAPGNTCTRGQIVTFLFRYMTLN